MVGTVTDASGAVVPGAQVTITNVNTNTGRSIITDSGGYYSFPSLPPATYRITVKKPGFAVAEPTGVALPVNSTIRADLRSRPAR